MSLCLLVEAPSHEEENGAITASPLEEEERRRNKATHGTEHDKLNHQLLYDGRDSQLNFTEVSERIDSPPSVSSDISPSHYRLEPQSVAELVQLSLARLEALSYIFTATAGVFIAGSYKAMAVKHFSDDAFLSNVGRYWHYMKGVCAFLPFVVILNCLFPFDTFCKCLLTCKTCIVFFIFHFSACTFPSL
jgi:uncharacterized membrane protein